ncbi:MAG: DUF1207 domain-containing protein, partial [Methylococcales bacterium]
MTKLRLTAVLAVMLIPAYAAATTQDDAYITGYAAGVLKQNLHLSIPSLAARDGVITLPVAGLSEAERSQALLLLSEIPGVTAVQTSELSTPKTLS